MPPATDRANSPAARHDEWVQRVVTVSLVVLALSLVAVGLTIYT